MIEGLKIEQEILKHKLELIEQLIEAYTAPYNAQEAFLEREVSNDTTKVLKALKEACMPHITLLKIPPRYADIVERDLEAILLIGTRTVVYSDDNNNILGYC